MMNKESIISLIIGLASGKISNAYDLAHWFLVTVVFSLLSLYIIFKIKEWQHLKKLQAMLTRLLGKTLEK